MILKTYSKKNTGIHGQDPESWSREWSNTDFLAAAEAAKKSHLSPFFNKYFPRPPKKILEGGCGTGKYVYAYRKLGYDIIGVDFAEELIRKIKSEVDASLPVYQADVTKLPFEDNYFDCYYSGGVVEHFEEGPEKALKEARRVLKKDGLLIVTVPYLNIIRRLNALLKHEKYECTAFKKIVGECRVDDRAPADHDFSAYFFDETSFRPYLENNGFSIEKTCPVDMLWGEIAQFVVKHIRKIGSGNAHLSVDKPMPAHTASSNQTALKSALYDFCVTENRDNIFFKIPISIINYLSGHMILFVAKAI